MKTKQQEKAYFLIMSCNMISASPNWLYQSHVPMQYCDTLAGWTYSDHMHEALHEQTIEKYYLKQLGQMT